MKHLFWTFVLFLFINDIIKVSTTSKESRETEQCIGKHQIPFENFDDFEVENELKEPIELKNFDVTPMETILENNDNTIVINMTFGGTSVPTIYFGRSSNLGTFRFEFLYLQWYENTSSSTLPIELHAVFYNKKATNFQNALKRKNNVVVLSFGLEVMDPSTSKYSYAVLKNYIKSVRTGLTKISIENLPLMIWLPAIMNEYILYEGYLPFFNCEVQVLWVNFETTIFVEPELLQEFELLQTFGGQTLMKQYKPFLAPSGPLIINFGVYETGVGGSMGAIPLVDAYNDDDENNRPFNGAFQSIIDGKMVILIIFLEFYFT